MSKYKFSYRPLGLISSALLVALSMGACTTVAKDPAPETKVVESYQSLMDSAEAAKKNGATSEALVGFERAAKQDPAQKAPWLRIAQTQFDEHNYGAAIIAAQEAQQRDNTDVTAKSIVVASGLRVSARALEQLRSSSGIPTGTMEEARGLAKMMRDALGEAILPLGEEPKVVAKPPVKRSPPPAAKPPATGTAAAGTTTTGATTPASAGTNSAAAASAAAPKATTAATPPPARKNPFDALK